MARVLIRLRVIVPITSRTGPSRDNNKRNGERTFDSCRAILTPRRQDQCASSAPLARSGWFDAGQIGNLAEAHIVGRSDHSRVLWQLLMLDRSLQKLGIA